MLPPCRLRLQIARYYAALILYRCYAYAARHMLIILHYFHYDAVAITMPRYARYFSLRTNRPPCPSLPRICGRVGRISSSVRAAMPSALPLSAAYAILRIFSADY